MEERWYNRCNADCVGILYCHGGDFVVLDIRGGNDIQCPVADRVLLEQRDAIEPIDLHIWVDGRDAHEQNSVGRESVRVAFE